MIRPRKRCNSSLLVAGRVVGAVFALALFVSFNEGLAQDVNRHVFIVRAAAGDCAQERSLTGFRVEGLHGIFTALHGVVGCTSITAEAPSVVGATTRELYTDLQIIKANIEFDVALLTSSELPEHVAGLTVESDMDAIRALDHTRGISVVGYPDESDQVRLYQVGFTDPALATINNRINRGIPALRERDSPSVEVELLSIEGSLYPGHSGAPILDERDRVLGIALGGIRDGGALGWAVPWPKVAEGLMPASYVRRDLLRLAELGAEAAFAVVSNQTLKVQIVTGVDPNPTTNRLIGEEVLIHDVDNLRSWYGLGLRSLDPESVDDLAIYIGEDMIARLDEVDEVGEELATMGVVLTTVDERFAAMRFRIVKDRQFLLEVLRQSEVPNVEGMSIENARREIEAAGLEVGEVVEEPSNEVSAGSIVASRPPKGVMIDVASDVDLTISTGLPVVPPVAADPLPVAESRLVDAGLAVQRVGVFSVQPEDSVLRIEPEAGTAVPLGSTVTVTVSAGMADIALIGHLTPTAGNQMHLKLEQAIRDSVGADVSTFRICDVDTFEDALRECAIRIANASPDIVFAYLQEDRDFDRLELQLPDITMLIRIPEGTDLIEMRRLLEQRLERALE